MRKLSILFIVSIFFSFTAQSQVELDFGGTITGTGYFQNEQMPQLLKYLEAPGWTNHLDLTGYLEIRAEWDDLFISAGLEVDNLRPFVSFIKYKENESYGLTGLIAYDIRNHTPFVRAGGWIDLWAGGAFVTLGYTNACETWHKAEYRVHFVRLEIGYALRLTPRKNK